jgi:hypothetical protein
MYGLFLFDNRIDSMAVKTRELLMKMNMILLLVFLLASSGIVVAADAPANVAAPLCLKVLGLENQTQMAGDITIHVIGSAEVAAALEEGVGQPVGLAKLVSVTSSDALPDSPPTVLFIASPGIADDAIAYTRQHKIISVTNLVDLVAKGITLGLGVEGSAPTILLNLSGSVEEGLMWEPAIMNIARTVE